MTGTQENFLTLLEVRKSKIKVAKGQVKRHSSWFIAGTFSSLTWWEALRGSLGSFLRVLTNPTHEVFTLMNKSLPKGSTF